MGATYCVVLCGAVQCSAVPGSSVSAVTGWRLPPSYLSKLGGGGGGGGQGVVVGGVDGLMKRKHTLKKRGRRWRHPQPTISQNPGGGGGLGGVAYKDRARPPPRERRIVYCTVV